MIARSAALAGALLLSQAVPSIQTAWAVEAPKLPADPRLSVALETDQGFNGVTVTGDGRIFMPVQRASPLKDAQGQPKVVVPPDRGLADGRTLYVQPCTGPSYRLETRLLDDPTTTAAALAQGVSVYADIH